MDDIVKIKRLLLEKKKRASKKDDSQSELFVDTDLFLKKRLHKKQYEAFVNNEKDFKSYCTSRQAGKTKGVSIEATISPIIYKNENDEAAEFVYISLTKMNGKAIIWNDILQTIEKENLKKFIKKIDETLCKITFTNGNIFQIYGAKDLADVEKLRGHRIRHAWIDEAQSFKDRLLEYLINEVLLMALSANNGKITMTGTPNSHCSGYFFKANNEANSKWKSFSWNIFDNTFIKNVVEFVNKIKEFRGLTERDPVYMRETLGLWVKSETHNIYKYEKTRNNFISEMEEDTYVIPGGLHLENGVDADLILKSQCVKIRNMKEWTFILGMDFGFNDECAWVVWGFKKDDPNVYLIETLNYAGIIPSYAAEITKKMNAKYDFYRMVGDTGGLGKGYTEEMKQRHNLKIEPAKKTEKISFIRMMNDDFRTSKIRANENFDICQEWNANQWEIIEIKEREGQDNHLSDAGLYGWRECRHYHFIEPEKKIIPGSQEDYDKQEEELLEKIESQFDTKKEWWET